MFLGWLSHRIIIIITIVIIIIIIIIIIMNSYSAYKSLF